MMALATTTVVLVLVGWQWILDTEYCIVLNEMVDSIQ